MGGFQEVVTKYIEYYLKDFMTAIPAVVVSADRLSESIVAVKPVINEKTLDGRVVPWPEIINVQLIFPCSNTSAVTFPVNVGDTVLVVFTMRCLDEWKAGSGLSTTPVHARYHDIQDAVAIPGLFPISTSKNSPDNRSLPHNVSDLTFTHNLGTGEEAEVRIKPSGQIEITSPIKIVVNSPDTDWNGNISLNGDLVHNGDNTHNGNTTQTGDFSISGTFTYNGVEYRQHQHFGVMPGSGTSGGVV